MSDVRLRQAVLVARSLDDTAGALREAFGLAASFEDPGVGAFGLRNAVFALGDQFLEVVSPVQDGTTAGRYLGRYGDGGYMVMFEVAGLDDARARAKEEGIREVWSAELDDISACHLHPGDMGAAIVSMDRPVPPGAWRWGGPDWEHRSAPGAIASVTVRARDGVAQRWSRVLGADVADLGVVFVDGDGGLCEIALALPGRSGETEIAGVRFRW